MATVVDGEFEWDSEKAAANILKHGVAFEEAVSVFGDPGKVEAEDASYPERTLIIGYSMLARILVVVTAEGHQTRTRIISARKATRHEQRTYAAHRG